MAGNINRTIVISTEFRTGKIDYSQLKDYEKRLKALEAANKKLKKSELDKDKARKSGWAGLTKARIMYFNYAVSIGLVIALYNKLAKPAREVEHAITQIGSVTGKTNEEIMNQVSLLRMGTIFTLKETAAAYLEVSKKGFDAAESFDIVNASTKLAIGGFTTLAIATDAISTTLNQFSLGAKDATHVANILAGAAVQTASTVSQLTTSLGLVGTVAAGAGISLEETVTTIGLLTNAGLRGSKSGTTLRRVIQGLVKTPAEASKQLRKLGFSATTIDGDFKSLNRIVTELSDALDKVGNEAERSKLIMDAFGIRGAPGVNALLDQYKKLGITIGDVSASLQAGEHSINLYKKAMESLENQGKETSAVFQSILQDAGLVTAGFGQNIKELFVGGRASETTRALAKDLEQLSAAMNLGGKAGELARVQFDKIVESLDNVGLKVRENATGGFVIGKPNLYDQRKRANAGLISFNIKSEDVEKFNQVLYENLNVKQKIKDIEAEENQLAEMKRGIDSATLSSVLEIIGANEKLNGVFETRKTKEEKLADAQANTENISAQALEGLIKLVDTMDEYGLTTKYAAAARLLLDQVIANTGEDDQVNETGLALIKGFNEEFGEMGKLLELNENKQRAFKDILDVSTDLFAKEQTGVMKASNALKIYREAIAYLIGLKGDLKDSNISELMAAEALYDKKLQLAKAEEKLKDKTHDLNEENRLSKIEFTELTEKIKKTTDEIKNLESEISTIQSRRFNINGIGETEVEFLIKNIELQQQKAEFSALGLGSAEAFLRSALAGTNKEMSIQVEQAEKLNDALYSSETRYKAWQETLNETMRSLLINSMDLTKDVTGTVQTLQTQLLGTNFFGNESGSGSSSEETQYIDALRMAQGIFFGEEQNKLDESKANWEDNSNEVNKSASEAINAIEGKRLKIEDLRDTEADWLADQEKIQKTMDDKIELLRKQKEAVYQLIVQKRKLIEAESGIINNNEPISGGDSGASTKYSGEYISGNTGGHSYNVPSTAIVDPAFFKYATGFDGLISNPTMMMVGENGPEHVKVSPSGQSNSSIGSVNININGNNLSSREIAMEVREELASLM